MAEYSQSHVGAAAVATVVLCSLHQFSSETGALPVRVDGEHSQVTALSRDLHVDGTEDLRVVILGDQKLSFMHEGRHSLGIRARALDEVLDNKGGIDHRDHSGYVVTVSYADID